jgi:hypothetical protein
MLCTYRMLLILHGSVLMNAAFMNKQLRAQLCNYLFFLLRFTYWMHFNLHKIYTKF